MGDKKLTYSVPEAAKALGIGKNLVRAAIARGELPVVPKVIAGSRVLIPVAALERLIAEGAEYRAKAS